MKEFIRKVSFDKLFKCIFKTNDTTETRIHKDDINLLQIIFQIIYGYFEYNCSDELSYDPVLTAIFGKNRLVSQPTLYRFFNRMDNDTLEQFYQLQHEMPKIVYDINIPDIVILDLDSTLLDTYGHQ